MKRMEQRSRLLVLLCATLAVACWAGCEDVLSRQTAAEQKALQAQQKVLQKAVAEAKAAQTRAEAELKVEASPEAKVEQSAEVEQPAQAEEPAGAETPAVDAETLQAQYEAKQKAMLEQIRSDPAWQGSHDEVAVIEPVPDLGPQALHNFCLNSDGNLLVCCGGDRQAYIRDEKNPRSYRTEAVSEPCEIRVVRPDGQPVTSWKLDSKPQAICVHGDGTVFVGGDGRLLKLSQDGKVLAAADTPAVAEFEAQQKKHEDGRQGEEEKDADEEATESKSVMQALAEALGGRSSSAKSETPQVQAIVRFRKDVTGIALSDQDLFVACSMTKGYGYAVWRMDHDFQNPKQIVENLRGCCGQMDIQAKDGDLWIAENCRFRAGHYDRDGKLLSSFGKRDRKSAEGFGGCCEPKNLRFGPDGSVYTAESGPPMVVKRFSPEGEFLGVVGLPSFQTGCVRVTVEVSRDGSRVYVLNTDGNKIHVLGTKLGAPTHQQVATIALPADEVTSMLHTFCLGSDGNFLVAAGGERTMYVMGPEGRQAKTVTQQPGIRVVSPDGKVLATWDVDMTPQAVNVAEDGTVVVGGPGRVARLDRNGKLLEAADSPQLAELPPLEPEPEKEETPKPESKEDQEAKKAKIAKLTEELKTAMEAYREASREVAASRGDEKAQAAAQAQYQEAMKTYAAASQALREASLTPEVLAAQRRAAAMRAREVKCVAATGDDVFICCRAAKGYGFDVWRTDRHFGNPKKIVTGLRGCCGNMDIQAHDGELWVAENARKRVVRYDRDGNKLASFGSSDRKSLEGFGSCCNPMCIRFGPDGMVYTAESNLGRIKRYSPEGELLGLVGTVKIVPGCKHVPIGINQDGSRVYMLDITRSQIAVMASKDDTLAKTAGN